MSSARRIDAAVTDLGGSAPLQALAGAVPAATPEQNQDLPDPRGVSLITSAVSSSGLTPPRPAQSGIGLRMLDGAAAARGFNRPVRDPADLFGQDVVFSPASGVPTLHIGGLPVGTPLVGVDLSRPVGATDLARLGLAPGDFLIGVVESTPSYPRVDAGNLSTAGVMQFGDHAFFLVADTRGGASTLQTLEAPRGQWRTNVGSRYADRPVRFYRLELPATLDAETARAYVDNIRTWAAILASESRFPSAHYTSGDAVGANTPERAAAIGDLALRGLTGDARAKREFYDNYPLYCSEFIYTAISLGLSYPLNAGTLMSRLGAERAQHLLAAMKSHNAFVDEGASGKQLLGRDGSTLRLAAAPANLRPISDATPGAALSPPTDAQRSIIGTLEHYAPMSRLDDGTLTPAQLAAAHAEILRSFKYTLPLFVAFTGLKEARTALFAGAFGELQRFVATYQHTRDNHEAYWAGIRERLSAFHARDDGAGLYVAPSFFANLPGPVGTSLVAVGVNERFLQPVK